MKFCRYCNTERTEDQFSLRSNGKLSNKCKQCVASYTRAHYQANKLTYKERAKKARPAAHHKWREFVASLKLKCEQCGEDHPAVLDFHHTDPTQKESNPADLKCSKRRFLAEIEKCIVLCSNCHRKLHWAERSTQ